MSVLFAPRGVHTGNPVSLVPLAFRIGPVFRDPRAHKNTWIKTKDDLSSVPHFGVTRGLVPYLGRLRRITRDVRDRQKGSSEGFGQGLSNEALSFYFRPFGRVCVCVLVLCPKCVVRGSM